MRAVPTATEWIGDSSPPVPAGFLRRQRDELRAGAASRLRALAVRAVALALAVPVALLVRAVRPLVLVRFGRLLSARFGHFAINTELYLCARDAGMTPPRAVDVFYHWASMPLAGGGIISNEVLRRKWEAALPVFRFAAFVDRVNRWIPGADAHVVRTTARDVHGLLDRTAAHLRFTAEETRAGAAAVRSMGIPDGAGFVCFHARDGAYETRIYPDKATRYGYRNSPIESYVDAARALAGRGLYAIRMGAAVDRPLATDDPGIVDYATRYRTAFLDLYLPAHCRFFLASGTGINAIPMIFRRPVVLVNFIPLEFAPTWSAHDLFLPKLLWRRAERRFLTFREILGSELGRSLLEPYEERGIDVIDNTAEDITAVSIEMDERLRGTWRGEPGDEALQRRFWDLWRPSDLNGVFRSRIGAAFLRRHASLLD